MKKALSMILTLALAACLTIAAFAADVTSTGSNGTVPVSLTAAASTFKVSVPTSLPITVDADGNVTCATDAKIVNKSAGKVKVSGMAIAGANGWTTVAVDGADMAAETVDAKKLAMTINNCKTTGADAIAFSASGFSAMNAADTTGSNGGECAITYSALVTASSMAIEGDAIANVVFTLAWDI